MTKLFSILVGILILCVIIVFHELGHLILAKKNGIAVTEFSIGFGPKLFGFKKNGTEYAVRAILIGGSCRMLGEEGELTDENAFSSKSVGARFSTLFAGPFFNFILAFILSVIVIGTIGYDPSVVTYVEPDSPAAAAGLQQGDILTEYAGTGISISRDLSLYEQFHETTEKTIPVRYERDGVEYSAEIVPKAETSMKFGFYYTADDNPVVISRVVEGGVFDRAGLRAGDKIVSMNDFDVTSGKVFSEYVSDNPFNGGEINIGIERNGAVKVLTLTPEYVTSYTTGLHCNQNGRVKTGAWNVIKYAFVEVRFWISNTFKSLGYLITGRIGSESLGGPVRIVSELENTVEESKADGGLYIFLNLINWAILLSANLGVMNLLPIPALDGGRLLLVIIEAIRRKPLPPEKEGMIHGIGVILLLILMVFVLFNDIKNVFFGI